MAILGLSKVWFISIVVTVITVVTGVGVIVVIATGIFIFGARPQVPASPTPITSGTPPLGGKPSA